MNDPSAAATFQLPEQMSTVAPAIDWLYYVVYWFSVIFFVAIVTTMLYWAIKYRSRKGHKASITPHNVPLEIAWTIAPMFFLAFIFHKGFQGYMDMAIAPADSIEIHVNAKQWSWEFVYPNGGSSPELHVPVHKPIKLIMGSTDVLHSFYVPALRVKRDVVPGMFTSVWFNATHTGHDDITCAEYCGGRSTGPSGELAYEPSDDPRNPYPAGQATGHWAMHSMIFVTSDDDYQSFLKSIGDKCDAFASTGKPCPADIAAAQGQRLYGSKGCLACHTTTGAPGIGPTWKGIWGHTVSTNVGTVMVDENYVRESILDPQAKLVTGFGPVMPTFRGQMTDEELNEVTEYIESLKN